MHTISIENSVFTSTYPCEEGHYLIKYHLTEEINLIKVYYIPPRFEYGREWDGYFSVYGVNGHNVRQFQAKFCKVEFK